MSIIFFLVIQIYIYKFQKDIKLNTEVGIEIFNTKILQSENIFDEEKEIKNTIWQINIPKIELSADISNGTDKETLNKYVGHFIETPIEDGNIALAGHNRGYDVNYFSRLKELREGDEIIYIHNEINRIYEVTKNKIIKDTDIDVLENTEENILTLITCVENEPNYRRCVQAEEKDLNYNY
jgi:LPXTG-site transpeptidase (sortase) family protein